MNRTVIGHAGCDLLEPARVPNYPPADPIAQQFLDLLKPPRRPKKLRKRHGRSPSRNARKARLKNLRRYDQHGRCKNSCSAFVGAKLKERPFAPQILKGA